MEDCDCEELNTAVTVEIFVKFYRNADIGVLANSAENYKSIWGETEILIIMSYEDFYS